jgi:hypothetical protein
MAKRRVKTRAEAEKRLMAIAFEFQGHLLDYVHGGVDAIKGFYTSKQAERLADEIQYLSYFMEEPAHVLH